MGTRQLETGFSLVLNLSLSYQLSKREFRDWIKGKEFVLSLLTVVITGITIFAVFACWCLSGSQADVWRLVTWGRCFAILIFAGLALLGLLSCCSGKTRHQD